MPPQNNNEMTPIEAQQIRGITMKSLWGLVSVTVVLTTVIVTQVNGVKSAIQDIRKDNETQTTINNLTIKALEARMSAIEADNKEIHYRIQRLETRDGENEGIKNR